MAGEALIVVPEAAAFDLATPRVALEAVRQALMAAADGKGWNNPVVIGRGLEDGETFSLKSGASRPGRLVGAKIGSYWPGAAALGLHRHSSVVVLLDPDCGRARAVVEAGRMNGRRTAAADAVAVDALARPDASVLAVLGAGPQAAYEIEAVMGVRAFDAVLVASRTAASAEALAARLAQGGVPARVATTRAAVEAADVIVTATPSREPLFDERWVRPGAHISAMGADQRGKQELPAALLQRAELFADEPGQARQIGEFQHAPLDAPIAALGDVLAGRVPGRSGPDAITVFDSSGLALQDLYVAAAVAEAWLAI